MRVFVALSYNRDHETQVCGASDSRAEALRIIELARNEQLSFSQYAVDGPNGGAAIDDEAGDCVGRILAFDVGGTAKLNWFPSDAGRLEAASSVFEYGGRPVPYVVTYHNNVWIASVDGQPIGHGALDECTAVCRKAEDAAILEAIQSKV